MTAAPTVIHGYRRMNSRALRTCTCALKKYVQLRPGDKEALARPGVLALVPVYAEYYAQSFGIKAMAVQA